MLSSKLLLRRNPKKSCFVFTLVDALLKILARGSYCFRSGAFVIEDPGRIVFNKLMLEGCHVEVRSFGKSTTHTVFMNPRKFAGRNKHTKSKSTIAPGLTSNVQYEIYYDKLFEWCKTASSRTSKNISTVLFYPFGVTDELDQTRQYLFVKFESTPWNHPSHVISAAEYYILSPKKATVGNVRSENKPTTKNVMQKDFNIYNIYSNQQLDDAAEIIQSVEFYENNVRSQAEFFVPSRVMRAALAEVDGKIRGKKVLK